MTEILKNNTSTPEVSSFFSEDAINPFESDYQNRFLKVFITDNTGFSNTITDILELDYFDSYQKIILKHEIDFFREYKEIAKFSALKDIVKVKEKGLTQECLFGLISTLESIHIENEEHIRKYAYNFFKERSVQNCLKELVVDWKRHNYDSMKAKLELSLKAGEPVQIGHDYSKDIAERTKETFRKPVSIMPGLDEHIGGGPAPGEIVIIMGPTGCGKSMLLVSFAAHAYKTGQKVVYYTLELQKEVIGRRIDAAINNIEVSSVHNFVDTIEESVEKYDALGGRLVIQEFGGKKATVNTLITHAKSLDFEPTLICVDYGDKLKPVFTRKDKWDEVADIFVDLNDMGKELGVPVISPTHSNRCVKVTEIVNIDGFQREIGSCIEGELILTHKGYKKITHVFPITKQPVYKIKLKNGKEIVVSAKHVFPTVGGKMKSIETGLSINDKLFVLDSNNFKLKSSKINYLEFTGEEETIDIAVEDTHMFFCNDIYVHNSGYNKETFELDSTGGGMGKVNDADLVLGIGRTPEMKTSGTAIINNMKNRNGEDGVAYNAEFYTNRVQIKIVGIRQPSESKPENKSYNNKSQYKKQDYKQQPYKDKDEQINTPFM